MMNTENVKDFRKLLPLYYDFYIIAKERSLSKAAKKNYVSQPSLTRSIQNLEYELGLALLNRTNKGISLTLDGEKLYQRLDGVFPVFDIEEKEKSELTGNITIGTTKNIADNCLSQFLSRFIRQYPNVKVYIVTDSATNLNEYLINHKIDVLIDYLPHINYSEKFSFQVDAIGSFKTAFACSEQFYETCKKNIKRVEDLKNYKLVIPGQSRRRQLLDEFLQSNNVTLIPMIEMPDSKLMADFIKENDWIGYFIEEEIEGYGLKKLAFEEELPVNSIGMIYPKKTVNEITKKWIELVQEKV